MWNIYRNKEGKYVVKNDASTSEKVVAGLANFGVTAQKGSMKVAKELKELPKAFADVGAGVGKEEPKVKEEPKPKSSILPELMKKFTYSYSYTKPEEELQKQRETAQADLDRKVREMEAKQGQPTQAPSPENPYANWSQEQAGAEVNPNVANYIEGTLLPVTRKFGIPDVLASSQWAIEGGRNPKNNPFGLVRNGEVLNYGSLEDNVRAYDETLRDIISTNMGINPASFKYDDYTPDTLLYYLQFQSNGQPGIKRYEAHMPNPQYYIDMNHAMPEWRKYK